jgi:putative selenium metabolism hydrolase
MISFAQALIQIKSLSSEEGEVIKRITAEMKSLGFDQVMVDEYGNAVGIIEGDKPGKTLLLDGHCDIVDANEKDWQYPPYKAVIADGNLYGRGVADMKGALAAMIHAAAGVNRAELAGRVVVSASVLEEVMEGEALRQVMDQIKPDFVIIGESTDFKINRAGRGRAEMVIETHGISAHSSSPKSGLCAVHEMMKVIQAFEKIPYPSDPLIGSAQMTLTDIISDPFPGHSVIPNHCRASFDRRLLPGETTDSIMAELKENHDLRKIKMTVEFLEGEEKTYTGMSIRKTKFFPAWKVEENHYLVQSAMNGLKKAGIESQIGSFGFCTNASYSAGLAGIPTIGFGPGVESDAHSLDEHISIENLMRSCEGFRSIIQNILH